jgi:hypothetical protein
VYGDFHANDSISTASLAKMGSPEKALNFTLIDVLHVSKP